MRSYALVIVGVCSVAVSPDLAQSMDEVIEIQGCAPGWILHRGGGDWWCEYDFPGGPGGEGGIPADDGPVGGGGGGGGGGGKTDPVPTSDPKDFDKLVKCGQCTGAGRACLAEAQNAEANCQSMNRQMAQYRCDYKKHRTTNKGGPKVPDTGLFDHTVTAWGCSITALWLGRCGGAEAPWNDEDIWHVWCPPVIGSVIPEGNCFGPGIYNCEDSWAQPHSGGSTERSHTAQWSVTFGAVNGNASVQIKSTYNLTVARGYLGACSDMSSGLVSGCTQQRNACYTQQGCTAEYQQ